MFNLVKYLSRCDCHRLTPGFPGHPSVHRPWWGRLLLFLVPHFDIVKTIGEECTHPGSGQTVLYLRRFYIFRSKWFGLNFGDIYLHNIVRSDDDADPHSHPWSFRGYVISGGYMDEQWYWNSHFRARYGPFLHAVRPRSFISRNEHHIHRVVLNPRTNAWTLIFTSGYNKPWHFITKDGPVFWRTYLGLPDDLDYGE